MRTYRKQTDIEKILRKWKGEVYKSGLIDELKRRSFYQKPSELKQTARNKAIYRNNYLLQHGIE